VQSENDLKFFPLKRLQRLAFRRLAAPRLEGLVLDIGAGHGPYHGEAPRAHFVSLDYLPAPVVQVIGSALALPFQDGCFDGVVMTETLEHIPRPQAALAEAARILKPGGWLYLTAPQMWPLHYEPHDYFRFTRYGLAALAASLGLAVVALEPVGGLYTFLFSRLGEKLVKLVVGLLGWLPRPRRWQVAGVLLTPVQLCLAFLACGLDRLSFRDVVGWALLARKGEGKESHVQEG